MNNDEILKSIIDSAYEHNILFSAMIELNSTCNWRCKHCYISSHTNPGLSKGTVLRLLNELRQLGCYELTLTGGEIFCRKDIMEIIRASRTLGFNVILFTNMSLLNRQIIKEIANLHVSLLSCTLFSLDDSTHDSITGVSGSLREAMGNIQAARSMNIEVEVKCIVMQDNINALLPLADYCSKNGFIFKPDMSIFSRIDGDVSNQCVSLSVEQMQDVISFVDGAVGYESRERTSDEYMCPQFRYSLSIDYNGNVNPCNRIPMSMGNINEKSLYDIWNNSPELSYMKQIKWKNLPECWGCENITYCVRCAGSALLEDGSLIGKSSLACSIAMARRSQYD